MAPFSQAIQSSLVRTEQDGTTVYAGEVDPEWMINAVPHGGYVLALLTNACVQHQAMGPHCDPLHVTTHYLKASSKGPFTVRVRRLKAGRGYSNLTAELVQNDTVRVMTHWIFGTILPPSSSTAQQQGDIHIPPSTSFYPQHPLSSLPKDLPLRQPRPVERFAHHVRRAHVPSEQEGTSIGTFVKDTGFVSGGWFEFADEGEELSWPALSFFADMNMATPVFLPEGQRPTPGKSWFPTLTLSVQFLAPLPRASGGFAPRTIGLHQSGRFISRPDSRHEEQVEIWTAPDTFAGDLGALEGWRDRQVCLCIASQMGLVVSGAINEKLGAKL